MGDEASEDALVLPDAWRRVVHPRRGGVPVSVAKPARTAPGKARALIDEHSDAVESLLESGFGDPDLAAAARRYLGGEADPAGAAALAAVLRFESGRPAESRAHKVCFEGWVAEHGIAFAACALVELGRTRARREPRREQVGAFPTADGTSSNLDDALKWRCRALLAAADGAVHDDAVRRLEQHRQTMTARMLAAYLVPDRQDWVDESWAEIETTAEAHNLRWSLLYSLGRPEQLASPLVHLRYGGAPLGMLATVAEGLGAEALPFFLLIAGNRLEKGDYRNLFDAVALLPTDEAFLALLERRDDAHARPALLAAMRRFPVRALRLLAAAGVRDLLDDHVRAHGEAVAEALAGMPEEARAVVEPIAASHVRVPDAPPELVPEVLADPVWRRPVKPVVAGLEPPATREAVWRDGEREEWLATETPRIPVPRDPHWKRLAESSRRGHYSLEEAQVLLHGPDEVVRRLLADWTGYFGDDGREHMRVLVARHGMEVFGAAVELADCDPAENGDVLLPFLDAGTAMRACGWAVRRGAVDEPGKAWLDRHGPAAVPFLLPAALGTKVRPRRAAETGLRRIAANRGAEAAVEAAPPEARDALRTLLAAHPAQTGLAVVGEIGDWADLGVLPQVLMRGGEHALPVEATRVLLEWLTLPASWSAEAVRAVRDVCDPASVVGFGHALFERWLEGDGSAKGMWALAQLGATGDDGTVRRLVPLLRAWGDGSGIARAMHGLDVLVAIGSDAAMGALYDIALKARSSTLWKEARRRFDRAAAERGLTTERFADRLVPDFGLDSTGSMVLDYGPRRFVVGFDEQLKPCVADESGRPRRALPKPGVKDDPELAPAAHDAFMTLKRDVRAVATDQRRRLQRAMVSGRRWESAEFRDLIAGHRLVRHLARRLVWAVHDGGAARGFRVAEDGTFADVHDDAVAVDGSAGVSLPHPLRLGGAVDAWSQVFADYEILQPFPQLGRPMLVLTGEERHSDRLDRFAGVRLSEADVAGLIRRGWTDDRFRRLDRTVGGVHSIEVEIEGKGDRRVLGAARLIGGAQVFGELDPVVLSEALTALTGRVE